MSKAVELLLPGLQSLTPFRAQIYSPDWRGRYPHLMPLDIAIWNRFLDARGDEFLGFQYDITLGQGARPLPGMSVLDKSLLRSMTVKRADCLGIRRDGLMLVEVKPRLGMACIGQLVSYQYLWYEEFGPVPPVEMAWVGERDEDDLHRVMMRLRYTSVIV